MKLPKQSLASSRWGLASFSHPAWFTGLVVHPQDLFISMILCSDFYLTDVFLRIPVIFAIHNLYIDHLYCLWCICYIYNIISYHSHITSYHIIDTTLKIAQQVIFNSNRPFTPHLSPVWPNGFFPENFSRLAWAIEVRLMILLVKDILHQLRLAVCFLSFRVFFVFPSQVAQ